MAIVRTALFGSLYSAVALVFLSPSVAQGETRPEMHGSLQLMAEQTAIEANRDFWVGLRFSLDPGWHIYWMNPGDSGEPPKIEWDLPAGFRAGAVRWPAPQRLEHPPLTDFGYEGEVLLMAPVHPSARLEAGSPTATLAANVKWLVCRDVCIPARERVTISLPVGKGAPQTDGRWHALFVSTRARLPKSAPLDWKTSVRSQGSTFLLSLETGQPETKAAFFPFEEQQIENAAPQRVRLLAGGIQLALQKSDQLLKPIANLKGVVVFGSGQASLVSAPVVQNARRSSR